MWWLRAQPVFDLRTLVGRGSRITQGAYGECRVELSLGFASSKRVPSRGSGRDRMHKCFENENASGRWHILGPTGSAVLGSIENARETRT